MERSERDAVLRAGIELFDNGRYLAAHELFEELWEDTQGPDSDFYKGLVQAAVSLHHLEQGNLEGAAKLHTGARRCLAGYLPTHGGLDLARFLAELQSCLQAPPERTSGSANPLASDRRPRLVNARPD